VGAALIGVLVAMPLVAERYIRQPPRAWAKVLPVAGVAGWLAVGGFIVVAGCLRALVIGIRISDSGVLVRNFFRTYRLNWPEVARFADGRTPGGLWALNVVTPSGLAVTASGTGINYQARGDVLTAIGWAAGRYGITAQVTGKPAMWEGPKSHLMPAAVVVAVIIALCIAVVNIVDPGGLSM